MHAIARALGVLVMCAGILIAVRADAGLDPASFLVAGAAGEAAVDASGVTYAIKALSKATGTATWVLSKVPLGTAFGYCALALTAYQAYDWAKPAVVAWMQAHGYYVTDQGLMKPGTQLQPIPGAPGVGQMAFTGGSGNTFAVKFSADGTAAYNEWYIWCTTTSGSYCPGGGAMGTLASTWGWGNEWSYWMAGTPRTDGSGLIDYTLYVYAPSHPEYLTSNPAPVTAADVTGALATDNAAGGNSQALALGAAAAILGQQVAAIDEAGRDEQNGVPIPAGGIAGITPAAWPGVRDGLLAGVDAATSDQVTAKDQPAAVVAGANLPVDQMTKQDVADAVKEGVKEGTQEAQKEDEGSFSGEGVSPEGDPSPPTKKSLTTVLQAFLSGLQSLPVVSSLQGSGFQVSGAVSYYDFDAPNPVPGGPPLSQRVDFAQWQDIFQGMGSVMLACTTLFCIIRLFRGGQ